MLQDPRILVSIGARFGRQISSSTNSVLQGLHDRA